MISITGAHFEGTWVSMSLKTRFVCKIGSSYSKKRVVSTEGVNGFVSVGPNS